jgi:hypothetical protein
MASVSRDSAFSALHSWWEWIESILGRRAKMMLISFCLLMVLVPIVWTGLLSSPVKPTVAAQPQTVQSNDRAVLEFTNSPHAMIQANKIEVPPGKTILRADNSEGFVVSHNDFDAAKDGGASTDQPRADGNATRETNDE